MAFGTSQVRHHAQKHEESEKCCDVKLLNSNLNPIFGCQKNSYERTTHSAASNPTQGNAQLPVSMISAGNPAQEQFCFYKGH